jgi:hypothetical protein
VAYEHLVGRVYVAGNLPGAVVALRPDSGPSRDLEGDLAIELRNLSGAVVEAWGERGSNGRSLLTVAGYRLIEIDGRRPLVGYLVAGSTGVFLAGEDSLLLADPHGQLAAWAGAKVWVQVDTSRIPAAVDSYGVIRGASPAVKRE